MEQKTPSSPPLLVWVTQGKSQHAARLLDSKDSMCLVRWTSTNKTDWVHQNDVEKHLVSRRRRRPAEPAIGRRREHPESESNKQSSASGRKKMASLDIHQDESDDDEVEVLLTILPPTPKRRKQIGEADAIARADEARRVSISPMPEPPCSDEGIRREEGKPSADVMNSCVAQESEKMDKPLPTSAIPSAKNDSLQEESPQYTFQSSAYVQNLAEICYTVLYDRRWRVEGRSRKRLFAWERGEDLSAVHLLSKLFTPPTKRPVAKCTCLLCRDETKGYIETPEKPSAAELDQCVLSQDTTVDAAKASSQVNPRPKIDDEVARAISLYCRLYYRKGPWFRLDDIYTRYYAPRKHFTLSENKENAAESEAAAEREDTSLEASRHSFFKRSSSSQLKTISDRQTNGVKKDEMIDQTAIQNHVSALVLLVNDIDHLNEIGLLRSFLNEEECGKTVGAVTLDGFGVILRAEERRAVVAKLGGGSKLVVDKNRRAASSIGASGRQRSTTSTENAIWKQMCRQRSISLGIPNDANKTKFLLPVCRHVDDLLFDKLATSIVLACSRADYVPPPVLRSAVSAIKTKLRGLLNSSSLSVPMCVTLREAPLLTLRRCGRLYMCATSGPGDMRSDGSNAWQSLKDVDAASIHPDVPLSNVVQPPGAYSWHRVVHPGLSHRFGITSCGFTDAHEFLGCDDGSCESEDKNLTRSYNILNIERADQLTSRAVQEQIFECVDAFRLWEESVELRAHVDYYLELNDTILYQARRQARENKEKDNTKGLNTREQQTDIIGVDDSLTSERHLALDFLELLSIDGRKSAIHKVLALHCATSQEHNIFASKMIDRVHQEVEHAITKLEAFIGDESIRALKSDSLIASGLFQTDSQKIIVILSTIILHVLIDRNRSITADEVTAKKSRPWLRHLYWEGVLAYALWDCIPVLERLRFFDLACSCLEVILYGKLQAREMMDTLEPGAQANDDRLWSLPHLLVSRRTRGKAYERLVINYVHILRWKLKSDSATNEIDPTDREALKTNGKKNRSVFKSEATPQDVVRRTISCVVRTAARTASIPFSAVRSLARRLKVPLAESLEDLRCEEVVMLGLRLDNANDTADVDTQSKKPKAYIDWLPPTDNAVANSIASEGTVVGQRCSYIGFEDDASSGADTSSLNVEQLAMEYYASGRLPVSENGLDVLAGGGWTGWHNEGGHVRALFRIICARPILGIDSGCGSECSCPLEALERLTIHLTPYQGAPFDLHVAHWEPSFSVSGGANTDVSVRSFYQRRRIQIDRFLTKLEGLSGQALCDLVYDSIVERLDSSGHGRVHDALLARDLQQIRTMSMLAAGFGGKQLSAMFRCLLFDYRHYSGGLPDLLLVRARYETSDSVFESERPQSLVDLGAWVGEGFSTESKMEQEVAYRTKLLIDKDDEFLGCSKIGDSGAQSSGQWRRGAQRQPSDDNASASDEWCRDRLPPKLVLCHDDRNVQVQCMFVEVKSLNDRLDGRQEDWLNVLDRIGNARVCKFGKRKKALKKTAAAK